MADDEEETQDELLSAMRIQASLKRRIEAVQCDTRVRTGYRVTFADIVRVLLEEAVTARERSAEKVHRKRN